MELGKMSNQKAGLGGRKMEEHFAQSVLFYFSFLTLSSAASSWPIQLWEPHISGAGKEEEGKILNS